MQRVQQQKRGRIYTETKNKVCPRSLSPPTYRRLSILLPRPIHRSCTAFASTTDSFVSTSDDRRIFHATRPGDISREGKLQGEFRPTVLSLGAFPFCSTKSDSTTGDDLYVRAVYVWFTISLRCVYLTYAMSYKGPAAL